MAIRQPTKSYSISGGQARRDLISLSLVPIRQSLAWFAGTLDLFSRFAPWGAPRVVSALGNPSELVQTTPRGESNGSASAAAVEPVRPAAASSAKPMAQRAAAKRPAAAKPAAAKRSATTKPAATKRPAAAKPAAAKKVASRSSRPRSAQAGATKKA